MWITPATAPLLAISVRDEYNDKIKIRIVNKIRYRFFDFPFIIRFPF